jgi:hypothetical protein
MALYACQFWGPDMLQLKLRLSERAVALFQLLYFGKRVTLPPVQLTV